MWTWLLVLIVLSSSGTTQDKLLNEAITVREFKSQEECLQISKYIPEMFKKFNIDVISVCARKEKNY